MSVSETRLSSSELVLLVLSVAVFTVSVRFRCFLKLILVSCVDDSMLLVASGEKRLPNELAMVDVSKV